MNITIFAYDLREKSLAGSYRTRKFVRYLSAGLDHIKVICAFVDEKFRDYCAAQGVDVIVVPDVDHEMRGFMGKIFVRAVAIPDIGARWARRALRQNRVVKAISESEIVYLSSPPHGLQMAGPYITSKFKIPFVADFRDDCVTNHRIKWRTPIHKKSAYSIERLVLRDAAAVVVNTDIVGKRFSARHSIYAKKISCITNGFDLSDIQRRLDDESLVAGEKTVKQLIYSGSAYDGFAVDAISRIATSIKEAGLADRWEIHTAGPGNWDRASAFGNWVHHGLLSQEDAAKLMLNADLLVLLMPPGEREPSGTVPLKAYAYLGSDRPIAYFGESGSTTDLLKEFEGTYSFHRDFLDRTGFWLLENERKIFPMAVSRYPKVEKYEFEKLTEDLRSVITSAICGKE